MIVTHKTIMIDANTYYRLSLAKEALQDKIGIKLSYGEILIDLMNRRIDLLSLDVRVKDLIMKFSSMCIKSGLVTGILLYGSLAKGTFDRYSDIDILVTVDDDKGKTLEAILSITKSLDSDRDVLMKEGLPSLISPVVLNLEDIKGFRPFYYEFADFGIIIYEESSTLSDFLYRLRYMKHERKVINNTEVLTW